MTAGDPDTPASAALAARLAEDLAIFAAHAPGFAARLATYVVDGSGGDALDIVTTLDASRRQDEMLIVRHFRHPHMRGRDLHDEYAYDGTPPNARASPATASCSARRRRVGGEDFPKRRRL